MRRPPDPTFQWIRPDGKPTQYFNEIMQAIVKSLPTKPVSTTDPTAGQSLKYNAATGQYEPS